MPDILYLIDEDNDLNVLISVLSEFKNDMHEMNIEMENSCSD